MTDALARAGELALAEAQRLWALDVIDPPKGSKDPRARRWLEVINDIIKSAGWGFRGAYLGNAPKATRWCGMFAAKCWRLAGLDPRWLASFWASTLRMEPWFDYKPRNGKSAGKRPARDGRMAIKLSAASKPADVVFPDGTMPRAGDIMVVGDGTPEAGDHIVICESFDPVTGIAETVGGNGKGLGPDNKRREGIVRARFKVGGSGFVILRVYRPGFGDLLAERVTVR